MPSSSRRIWILRHSRVVRLTHWVNVVCLAVLLMSGLQIFNAHPALYWGLASDFARPLVVLPPFPGWATLPGEQWLAMGRRWHFFFAWLLVGNGAVYLVSGFVSGHFRRDLLPSGAQWRAIGHTVWDHLRLRFPTGDEARHYNILQKLAYLVVIFALLPAIVLAGMTMSPQLDSLVPQLLDLFGGRQSARTVHFVCAAALLGFVGIHVAMVVLSGLWNNIRSMITGRYALDEVGGNEEGDDDDSAQ